MGRIMPSKLHRVKVFESVEWLYPEDGGFRRGDESDDIIEVQVNKWIIETQSMIVSVGTPSVVRTTADPETHILVQTPVMMTRTLAIVYAPAVEQGDEDVGSDDVPELGSEANTTSQGSAPRISDGGFGGQSGDRLRLPDVP